MENDDSIALGMLDSHNNLNGLSSGLWTKGKTLPTFDSELSPTLLFAPWGDEILIAGHFTHQYVVEMCFIVSCY